MNAQSEIWPKSTMLALLGEVTYFHPISSKSSFNFIFSDERNTSFARDETDLNLLNFTTKLAPEKFEKMWLFWATWGIFGCLQMFTLGWLLCLQLRSRRRRKCSRPAQSDVSPRHIYTRNNVSLSIKQKMTGETPEVRSDKRKNNRTKKRKRGKREPRVIIECAQSGRKVVLGLSGLSNVRRSKWNFEESEIFWQTWGGQSEILRRVRSGNGIATRAPVWDNKYQI